MDDNKYNIEGFITALPSSSTAQRIGIHFKNPIQLAKELIKLGVLSEIDDKKFLDELYYPRIFDTLTSGLQYIFAHL